MSTAEPSRKFRRLDAIIFSLPYVMETNTNRSDKDALLRIGVRLKRLNTTNHVAIDSKIWKKWRTFESRVTKIEYARRAPGAIFTILASDWPRCSCTRMYSYIGSQLLTAIRTGIAPTTHSQKRVFEVESNFSLRRARCTRSKENLRGLYDWDAHHVAAQVETSRSGRAFRRGRGYAMPIWFDYDYSFKIEPRHRSGAAESRRPCPSIRAWREMLGVEFYS